MSSSNDEFYTDVILEKQDVCNLAKERIQIDQGIKAGQKLLVYGKRNTGKTSVVKNVIGFDWKALHPNGVFIYLDFFGVATEEQILSRLTSGLAQSIRRSFPVQTSLLRVLDVLKLLRPKIEFDSSGLPSLTLGVGQKTRAGFEAFFESIAQLYSKKYPVLIVFDEFQDIHQVPEAEGILRNYLQNLPGKLPVVIMGSKKHILSQMFSSPKRAFFNWGNHIEFGLIPYEEFTEYINIRLKKNGMRIDPEISKILQDTMNRDPEAINRICQEMISRFSIPRAPMKSLTVSEVADATRSLLEKRRSALEEYLNRFTPAEERVLIAFSKQEGREMQPMGKAFLEKSNLTAGGMKKIIDRLLDSAVLYHEKNEYSVADPFVWRHLKEFRA